MQLPLVVTCEHAHWELPANCDLGVPESLLASQASWDHGALDIAQRIAANFAAPLLRGEYSRMWVDLNRSPDHPNVVPRHSYGVDVPGNMNLTAAQIERRIDEYHAPYWRKATATVNEVLSSRGRCVHISSHSFCPSLDPAARDFEIGILFDPVHRFESLVANQLISSIRALGISVRSNEPYSGIGPALVTSFRSQRMDQDYAGIEIETSHAVTVSPSGIERISAAMISALSELRLS
jgi:predicted N-formylglutamate amidohydrolase